VTTDFDGCLYALLALVGRRVEVTLAAADGEPYVACMWAGTLEGGFELTDTDPPDAETFFFPLDAPDRGFFLSRDAFRQAEVEDWKVTATIGPLKLIVEAA
jgi:hypothetical protein